MSFSFKFIALVYSQYNSFNLNGFSCFFLYTFFSRYNNVRKRKPKNNLKNLYASYYILVLNYNNIIKSIAIYFKEIVWLFVNLNKYNFERKITTFVR